MNWKQWQKETLEPFLHDLMGMRGMEEFVEREINQLPPANDRLPPLFVGFHSNMAVETCGQLPHEVSDEVYWSATRVLDMLMDILSAARGFDRTRRWAFSVGLLVGVLVGFPVGAFLTKGLL